MDAGWIDPHLSEEFPDLALWSAAITARATRSVPEVRDLLRDLADRVRGPQAVQLRRQPVPAAYRVFFRHIGLDPDVDRTPVEALVLERLRAGGFPPRNTLDDALTVATMETGVGVWALDADRVTGELRISVAADGRLLLADDRATLARLFGEIAPEFVVTRDTVRMRLFAVQVAGVPLMWVEEALWRATELLTEPGS